MLNSPNAKSSAGLVTGSNQDSNPEAQSTVGTGMSGTVVGVKSVEQQ